MKVRHVAVILAILVNALFGVTAVAPSAGDGTSGDPYQIASFENLYWIQQNSTTWDKYFIQTADIDASASSTLNDGAGWDPIGPYYTAVFSGHYDGQGYVIDALYANRPEATDYTGLFGQIWNSNSEIKNIHLTNIDITGNDQVGAIAGVAYAKISSCSSSGSISGDRTVGGLIGSPANSSPINNCYSTATVSGSRNIGGLAGSSEATMQTSYFTGSVTGDTYTGGLAGENYSTISDCYCAGIVNGTSYVGGLVANNNSRVEDSYFCGSIDGTSSVGGLAGQCDDMMGSPEMNNCIWNSDTISTGIASGMNFGTSYSKTTAEMKIQSTYTAISWDFTTIWSMDADTNNNYPYFSSNPPSETALPICLSEFNAEQQNGCVCLTWCTESETDNAHFLIYRNNQVLASIEGAGTTTEPHRYEFIDDQVIPGNTYTYVLADISYANEETKYTGLPVTVTITENDIPAEFALEANYPNPFNPVTMINFELSETGDIDLSIYDMTGKIVANLIHGNMQAGFHQTAWNASGFVSGIYFYRLTAGDFVETKKMVLMK